MGIILLFAIHIQNSPARQNVNIFCQDLPTLKRQPSQLHTFSNLQEWVLTQITFLTVTI